MSKIDKITNVFTKTISALIVEGDKLVKDSIKYEDIATTACFNADEARRESQRAFKIAAKLEGVLS